MTYLKRFVIVILGLCFLVLWSVVVLVANDIAETNPIIKKILQIKEVPIEKVKTEIETVYIEKEVEVYWYQFLVTGYSANDPSQGTNETMASGKKVYVGAVAADPSVLPLGTKIEIKGLGLDREYTVEDTGGKIKGLHIDIFCESKFEALQINQMVWVRIIKEGK